MPDIANKKNPKGGYARASCLLNRKKKCSKPCVTPYNYSCYMFYGCIQYAEGLWYGNSVLKIREGPFKHHKININFEF